VTGVVVVAAVGRGVVGSWLSVDEEALEMNDTEGDDDVISQPIPPLLSTQWSSIVTKRNCQLLNQFIGQEKGVTNQGDLTMIMIIINTNNKFYPHITIGE
jgi:hypothetical protein